MAEAQATRRSGSVAHVEGESDAEIGFVGEGGQDSRETIDGFEFRDEDPIPQKDVTVGVDQPLPRQRRCSICGELGHTARTCTAEGTSGIATRASRKPSKEAVGAVAPMLVGTLNFSVVSTFGSQCGLTDMEAKILIPSVQRMMERLPAATATKAALILDPLIIFTVFFMWGRRILAVKQAEARQKYAVEPFEQMRAAGATGTDYRVPNEAVSHSVSGAYQHTNGAYKGPQSSVSNINAAAKDRSQIDEGVTDTSAYGVPKTILESFDADF